MGNHPYTMYARRNKFKRKSHILLSLSPEIALNFNFLFDEFMNHNIFLADSVVVITGASSGMGKELTYRYAERGCKIVITARNMKEL